MTTPQLFRLISYSKEITDGQPIYVSSNCLPVKAVKYEPAGHSFHALALQLRGFSEKKETKVEDDQNIASEKSQSYFASSDSYSSKGKKKPGENQQQDHYALLGLAHLRFLATEEQIRKSYRETALKYHPDKQAALLLTEESEAAKEAKKDEIESHFKSIQVAYEVLMDPVKRRVYDSTDEFDDEVPTDCAPQDFFKVFGPAFMRNGRWSVSQPVPPLGEDDTPLKEVDSFYDFWYGFKSWREFAHEDEFDLEQAESRDHKRWMERQNSKLKEKAKKEEYTRVRSLVDNAYKRDPRIVRRKELEKAEKQKRKEAKYLGKKLQEEEAARAAEEERLRKEKEDKQAALDASNQKKIREKEKKLLRKERSRLRTVSASLLPQRAFGITGDDVESLCMSFEIDRLRNLCSELEEKEDDIERAQVLREALGRSTDDLKEMKKDKNQQQNGSLEGKSNGVVVQPKAENRKPAPTIESPLTTRHESEGTISPSTNWPEANGTKLASPEKGSSSNGYVQNPEVVEAPTANGFSSIPEQEIWSAVQEKALFQALKTFPKEITQRWERVATAVPGKTVSQCKKKFASMKESFRNKKA